MKRLASALVFVSGLSCAEISELDGAPTTPPETAEEEDLTAGTKIVAVGDIACKPGSVASAKRCQHDATSKLVSPSTKAVLLLGDNQYSEGELLSYQGSFEQTWGRHTDRLWPVPGNHEYGTPKAAGYFAYFGDRAGDPAKGYYSGEIGKWHVIALNTNDDCKRVACDDASAQLAWLRADLAAIPKKRCSLAFFHHPRWSSGEHGDNPKMDDLWRALVDGGVDLVLAGHDHDYERFAPRGADGARDDANGVRSFVVGTGGIGFRAFAEPSSHSEAKQADTFGVLALTLGATSYSWSFLPIGDAPFRDDGRGKCH